MTEQYVSITVPAFSETLNLEISKGNNELLSLELSRSGANALIAMISTMLKSEDDCESMSLHLATTIVKGVNFDAI